MRWCLSALSVSLAVLLICVSRTAALPNSAVVADATTKLPPPHQNAVTAGCTGANCPTVAITNLGTDGGWVPGATSTVTVNAPAGMKGFLLYAAAPNGKHVGTLTVTQGNAQNFDSATPPGSTLQHVNNAVQKQIVATWTAPQAAGAAQALTFTLLALQTKTQGVIVTSTLQQTNNAAQATVAPTAAPTAAPTKAPAAPAATTKAPAAQQPAAAAPAAAAAAPVVNCFITVPNNALTAAGLATPYILSTDNTGNTPCTMANTGSQAFVQGAVIDTATGKISVYNPIVITMGTQPAVKPTAPKLPANNVVAVWFGFNGNNLTLKNAQGTKSVTQANCVNGVAGSTFTQFAYCNAPAFFNAVQNAYENGQIATAANAAAVQQMTGAAPAVVVPALGTASDGGACPTLRDFFLVDMDPSDNMDVTYLVTAAGLVAQNTAANRAALKGTTTAINPGDNLLLTTLVNPAIKCAAGFMAPDLADNNNPVNALPLSEIQATLLQGFPQARVPAGDPMVLKNNKQNVQKINNFRLGVMQAPINSLGQANTACFCKNMAKVAPARLMKNSAALALSASFAAGQNLFQFLVTRFNQAVGAQGLNCAQFGVNTAFTVTNPQFMPTNNEHRMKTKMNGKVSVSGEEVYVWHRVPAAELEEGQSLVRMHVLDANGDPTTVTVDENMISSYEELDMSSMAENMDHNNALGLEMDIFANLDVIMAIAGADPGTENADPGTNDSFLQTTTGIAVIIAVAAVGAIAIIAAGSYCYLRKRKQHTNTVSTMAMSSV